MAPTPNTLASTACTMLREFFDQRRHYPSGEHWDSLGEVLGTMESMAEGRCPSNVFVGPLDPGVGKSSAVIEFAKVLMNSAEHRHIGMIICVGRVAEAASMAEALRHAPGASLAVLTGKEDVNARGSTQDPQAAQVLITTQQRLELLASDGRFFAAMAPFHFQGTPRQVRVWDEAWLPGVPVALASDDILLLVKPVRQVSDGCARALRDFAARLDGLSDGDVVEVPDFPTTWGVSFHHLVPHGGKLRDDQHAAALAMAALSGRTARVRHDGQSGCAVLTYKDTLPKDLAPLLVLDASARVRKTYEFIESHRGGLVKLREAVKDYSPLKVHTWEKSGSKSGWGVHGQELIDAIAETILERPDEAWLVIHHAKVNRTMPNVDAQVRRRLRGAGANVEFLTWGRHMATNLYADFPNVILAGTLFMKPSHYTALTHLAQGKDAAGGFASADDIQGVRSGEHANIVLQGLCRGRVRKSDGSKCLPMNAYIIASRQSGIAQMMTAMFPGCEVLTWRVETKRLPGKLKEALGVVTSLMDDGAETVSTTTIRNAIKVGRQNFPKMITDRPEWTSELSRMGMVFVSGRGKPGEVRRVLRGDEWRGGEEVSYVLSIGVGDKV